MTQDQINELVAHGEFPGEPNGRELITTHISWVILGRSFVYKIKKPINYSFLDFSTLEQRKYFCHREVLLNRRFAKDIYLGVVPVFELNGSFRIGEGKGVLLDHAVKMLKLDPEKRMDLLIQRDQVSPRDIQNLTARIADFHKCARVIHHKEVLQIRDKFNDLGSERDFLNRHLGRDYGTLIEDAIETSDVFLRDNQKLLEDRLQNGFFRDCHGDLHTRNIFLLPKPQLFDCIEFNDGYRQIDVLNEMAFLCMDLDALGRTDLSKLCAQHYNLLLPSMKSEDERLLFIYYKGYRANVRAKVNSLRAKSAALMDEKKEVLAATQKYLRLMEGYLKNLKN